MKFYEKLKATTLVTLLSVIFLFYSCGGESTDTIEEENVEIIENYKLLKRVTYKDYWFNKLVNMDFSYSEGLLVKGNNAGELVYFGYNSDNKIISEQECSDQNLSDINIDTYNCSEFYPPYNATPYTYTNGLRDGFNYDDKGNLISDIAPAGSDSLYYTYDSNGIVVSEYVTDGNGGYTLTFEWDGKKNPFNVLWEKYGYYNWGGESFEPYGLISNICKNNATKVFSDGELIMEAVYTYNSDGYPIRANFIKYFNDGSTREGTTSLYYVE